MANFKKSVPALAPNSKYVMKVRAFNNLGVASDWSEAVLVSTPGDDTVPNAPTDLVTSFVTSSLIVSWTAPTTNTDSSPLLDLSHYIVTLTGQNGVQPVASYTTSSTFFVLTIQQNEIDFDKDSAFDIEVRAVDASGNESAPLTGNAENAPPPDPTEPPFLVPTFTVIFVSAQYDLAGDIAGYEIYHSTTEGGTYTLLATTSGDVYPHEVADGTEHWYKYKPVDVFGRTSTNPSPAAGAESIDIVDIDTTPPANPTGISLVGTGLSTSGTSAYADLQWTANTEDDMAFYEIRYRKNADSVYEVVAFGKDITDYRFTNLDINTHYRFQVRATDTHGNQSGWAPADPGLSVTTPIDTTAPDAPTGLTTVPGISSILLRWDTNSEADLQKYRVYGSTTPGFTPDLTNLLAEGNSTFYTHITEGEETWYFVVTAVDNTNLESDSSAEASETSIGSFGADTTPPPTPTGLTLEVGLTSSNQTQTAVILASWDPDLATVDLAGHVVQYRIKPSTVEWGGEPAEWGWDPIVWGGEGSTAWSTVDVPGENSVLIPALHANLLYEVRVASYDTSNNFSAFTDIEEVTTPTDSGAPAAPTGISLTSGIRSIIIQWAANLEPDLAGYEIHVSPVAGFTPSNDTIAQVRGPGTATLINKYNAGTYGSPTWTDLSPDTTYYVRMKAVDVSGNKSAASAQFSETTSKIVDADVEAVSITKLIVGDLTVAMDIEAGGVIRTATSGTRMEMDSDGLRGYDGVLEVFNFDTGDGSLTLTGPITTGGSITGATITGGTIQTDPDVAQGIKLTNAGMLMYAATGGIVTMDLDATDGSALFRKISIAPDLDEMDPTDLVINSNGFQVTAEGQITATSGVIGGFTIDTNELAGAVISGGEINGAIFNIDNGGSINFTGTGNITWAVGAEGKIIVSDVGAIESANFDDTAKTGYQLTSGSLKLYDGVIKADTIDVSLGKIQHGQIDTVTATQITTGTLTATTNITVGPSAFIQSFDYDSDSGYQLAATGATFQNGGITLAGAGGFMVLDSSSLRLATGSPITTRFKLDGTGLYIGGGTSAAPIFMDSTTGKTVFQSVGGAYQLIIDSSGATDNKVFRFTNGVIDPIYFKNDGSVFFAGTITGASELHIGGNDASSFHVDNTGNIWSGAGDTGFGGAPFKVTNLGVLSASGATISGNVTITSGSIAIGSAFTVSNTGVLTATSANISGAAGTTTLSIGTSPNNLVIDAAGLYIGGASFAASKFKVDYAGNLTAQSITGSNTVGNSGSNLLKSGNFVTGVSGWQITGDGNVEFNDGIFRGTLVVGSFDNLIRHPGMEDVSSSFSPVSATPHATGTHGSIANVSNTARSGVRSMLWNPAAGTPAAGNAVDAAYLNGIPTSIDYHPSVVRDEELYFEFWAATALVSGRSIAASIRWYTGAGSPISTTSGIASTVTTGFTKFSVSGIAPSNAAYAVFLVTSPAQTENNAGIYIDDFSARRKINSDTLVSILVGHTIQSSTWTGPGSVAGWQLTAAGDFVANTGTFRGTLDAANGTFTGTVSGGAIDIGGADSTSFHVDTGGNMWMGDAAYANAPFRVSNTGQVRLRNADGRNLSINSNNGITLPTSSVAGSGTDTIASLTWKDEGGANIGAIVASSGLWGGAMYFKNAVGGDAISPYMFDAALGSEGNIYAGGAIVAGGSSFANGKAIFAHTATGVVLARQTTSFGDTTDVARFGTTGSRIYSSLVLDAGGSTLDCAIVNTGIVDAAMQVITQMVSASTSVTTDRVYLATGPGVTSPALQFSGDPGANTGLFYSTNAGGSGSKGFCMAVGASNILAVSNNNDVYFPSHTTIASSNTANMRMDADGRIRRILAASTLDVKRDLQPVDISKLDKLPDIAANFEILDYQVIEEARKEKKNPKEVAEKYGEKAWKRRKTGLIADYAEEVDPDLLTRDQDGMFAGFDYDTMFAYVFTMYKVEKARADDFEARLAKIEKNSK